MMKRRTSHGAPSPVKKRHSDGAPSPIKQRHPDGTPSPVKKRHSDGAPSPVKQRHPDGAPSFVKKRHSDGAPSFVKKRHSDGALSTPRLLLLAILLLASFLRFYRLDTQSFWNDEGNSARIAERTPRLILEGAEGDVHPPGYYLLIHYWRALAGQSEFALRSFSVAVGVLLVVFTYLLGRYLFGENTGLMAAFLGAISPFAIYYSQEARMYALLAALSASATLSALSAFYSHSLSKGAIRTALQRTYVPYYEPSKGAFGGRMERHPNTQAPQATTYRSLAAYILTSVAALYTHYAFPFVLAVHNVVFGLWWLVTARRSAHRWRWLTLWLGSQLAILALYLPWLPTMLRSTLGRPAAGRTYELGQALLDVFRILSVGTTLPIEEATTALVGTGLSLIAGVWLLPPALSHTQGNPAHEPHREDADIDRASVDNAIPMTHRASRGSWLGVTSIALYLLLPVALILALDLYKPAWLKFLVVVLPPFHILVARGIENLAKLTARFFRGPGLRFPIPIRLLALAFFTIVTVPSLRNLYFNPTYARDDYRQIAADIAASAHSSEAVILNAPNQWEVFTYYRPDQDVYPAPYHPDPSGVERFMSPLIEEYDWLRVLYWGDAESDPHRLIETWLAEHSYKAGDTWYGRVRLATYGVAPLPQEPAVAQADVDPDAGSTSAASDVQFGDSIRLQGHALAGDQFAPGDILPVTLFWEAQAPIEDRYKVTLQVLDSAGQLIAQHDEEPGDSLNPTNTWDPGQVLADRYGVLLPADLSPGRYTLIVGMYHISTGERLPIAGGGNHAVLGSADIDHTSVEVE